MKKISFLRITMLTTLALQNPKIYGDISSDESMTQSMQNQEQNPMLMIEEPNQAVALMVQSAEDTQATTDVIQDLAQIAPQEVERIIQDEEDLNATFSSLKRFIAQKNREIDQLIDQNYVDQTTIARLGVELAHTQSLLEKYTAMQRLKHKKNNKHETAIKDALHKAEQGVKLLYKRAIKNINNGIRPVMKQMSPKKTKKRSKVHKAVVNAANMSAHASAMPE